MQYPYLQMISSTDFDEPIQRAYELITGHSICWMALEEIEIELPKKDRTGLVFKIEANTINISSRTGRLLAKIWFEPPTSNESAPIYRWTQNK